MNPTRLEASHAAIALFILGIFWSVPAASASPPSAEEMWKIIQQQQKTIEELKARLEATDGKVTASQQRIESTEKQAQAAEKKAEEATAAADEAGASSSTAASWVDRTHLGGYGELHYNNLENETAGTELDRVDFHRFVLYVGHEFTDWLRFNSELELEHTLAGDDEPGEVELEQAYIEMDVYQNQSLRAGIQVLPVGIINETHEPPTFYGVERNLVETNIIPTTWWEAALGAHGEVLPSMVPGLSYHVMLHSGLQVPVTGANAFRIRNGRQKVAEASADEPAFTGQIRYAGIPGVELAVSGQYQSDVTSDSLASGGIAATLFSGHAIVNKGPFGLRALYARWDLDDGLAADGPATGPSPGRDVQVGWYVEPSYRFALPGAVPGDLGLFARYSETDNNAGDASTTDTEIDRWDVGFNWWPHQNVVFKFDYQNEENGSDNDGFNLGLGYQF